jgi:predicted dehydrogenase
MNVRAHAHVLAQAHAHPGVSRRRFVRSGLAAALAGSAFPSLLPSSLFGADAPSKRVTVGVLGSGPRARDVLGGFLSLPDVQVVTVCDVKTDQLEKARQQVNGAYKNQDCATSDDFRQVLARKDIDAVLIGSPDHWHVAMAVAAARAGKDLYLEKPMGLTFAEDQLLRREVRKGKRVFQFGTQQRSSRAFLNACELVRNGRIGSLKEIHVWCSASKPGGSTAPAPIPAGLNYERWLGPARFTPYTADKCHESNKTWWFNNDYALGFIAGWGVHPLDIALWGYPAMMTGPMEVEGKGVFPGEGACNTAVAWEVNFALAGGVRMNFRGVRNGFNERLAMNDFSAQEKRYGKIADHGTAFEGSEGWILVDRTGMQSSAESLEPMGPTDKPLVRSTNHVRNFVDAIKSRGTTVCPIDEAVQTDSLCHVSDIATRVNRKVTWDPRKEEFVKDKEANGRLEMRAARKS